MGDENETMVVEVVEGKSGELEHTAADGKKRTYYPSYQNWVELEELGVWQHLREPEQKGDQPRLVTQLRGEACLDDYDISVIGEPDNKARRLRFTLEAGDVDPALAESDSRSRISLSKPLGGARLGFSRADWEIGNQDEWWLSCQLPDHTITALRDAIAAGRLRTVKLGVRMQDLYTTDHPLAPASSKSHLYLRPSRSGKSIEWPEMAYGYVIQFAMELSRVDMRPVELDQDNPDHDHMEVRKAPPDQVALALGVLTDSVLSLRSTLKWVGGIAVACLVVLALK
ncbi:hypothetical protein [Caenimonas aquaedulcis]|uniref:Uncharacterized protein n=1 Tax=Caenimonas aquaedulcis TaxID=2793270 RepID=A0A931MI00_9BURK|nr:hypothetical protein [Caenimonas aquaedulcis]MBG9389328.1 hypothetical protein [Caenimonas aquaedulcis]